MQEFSKGVPLYQYLESLTDINAKQQFIEKTISTTMHYFGYSLLKHGMIHGDPHLGNILFDETDNSLVFIDWGQSVIFNEKKQKLLCNLFSFAKIAKPMVIEMLENINELERLDAATILDNEKLRESFNKHIKKISEDNIKQKTFLNWFEQNNYNVELGIQNSKKEIPEPFIRAAMNFAMQQMYANMRNMGLTFQRTMDGNKNSFLETLVGGIGLGVLDTDERVNHLNLFKKFWKYLDFECESDLAILMGSINLFQGLILKYDFIDQAKYSTVDMWADAYCQENN